MAETTNAAITGITIWNRTQRPPTSLIAPTMAPKAAARSRSAPVGWSTRHSPTVSTTWPTSRVGALNRGRIWTISWIWRHPSPGSTAPTRASFSTSNSAEV